MEPEYFEHLFASLRKQHRSRKRHIITREQVDLVVAELKNSGRKTEPSLLIAILSFDLVDKHNDVLEPFLTGPDVDAAERALTDMCTFYSTAYLYGKEILAFMEGVSWDSRDRLKGTAVSLSGIYLGKNKSRSILAKLIEFAEDRIAVIELGETNYEYETLPRVSDGDIAHALYHAIYDKGFLNFTGDPELEPTHIRTFKALLQQAKERLITEGEDL
jgi:hypothetical protein